MKEDIKNLLLYFYRQPDDLLAHGVFDLIGKLPEPAQKKVVRWIVENVPKKNGLDIPTVSRAIKEVGPIDDEGMDSVPIRWECDLCSHTFNRVLWSNDDLRKKGLFDYCPVCGLSPFATEKAARYRSMLDGVTPEWYLAIKRSHAKNFLFPGLKRYDPEKDEAFERERAEERTKRISEALKKEVSDSVLSLVYAKRAGVR